MKARNVLFYFTLLLGFNALGQNFAVEVSDASCQTIGEPIALSQIVYINGPDDDILEGLQISVIENYQRETDNFTYNIEDGIYGIYDRNNGIYTLTGQASIAKYRSALERLFFTSTTTSYEQKTINITMSGIDFLVETGHFYQFFAAQGISWTEAKVAAESKSIFGLQGYLTTITSATENKFILDRVSGTAWIGASDAEKEGEWKWVTGPEAGTIFWVGMMNGRALGYHNWQPPSATSGGEPNQSGDEDYAHMMSWTTPSGQWNDLPDQGGGGNYVPTGYIVEYGGQNGDPDVLSKISGTTIIDWRRDIEVTGSTSVCPNIEGVPYQATALDAHSYNWSIEGGTIISGQQTNQIFVKWGDTNANAKVSVQVSSDIFCKYNEELIVKINEQLEPPLPLGSSFVCFTDLSTAQKYSTPYTPGSDYQWKPTNGTVISGQGSNEVEILWNGTGTGSLYFTESTSTATDICDGDSPTLTVDLREEIIASFDIENVKCFEGNDGSVKINVATSGSAIDFDWIVPNTALITNDEVKNLQAGSYSVWVTLDDCRIEFPFEISQPDELAEQRRLIEPVICFGESNGSASFEIIGGTAPYSYQWSHNPDLTENTANDLPAGNHSLEILDANNCQLVLNFEITEPELLVVKEIISTLVSCPGGSDGTLEAIVSGGTGAYSYEWEYATDTESLASGFPKGTYSVVVTDENGCQATSTQVVEEAIPRVVLPNAFSPNGDQFNDSFGPNTPCEIIFKMEVYNRWGQVIFSTNSAKKHWDGTFNGSKLPLGKYAFAATWTIIANDLIIKDSKRGEIKLVN